MTPVRQQTEEQSASEVQEQLSGLVREGLKIGLRFPLGHRIPQLLLERPAAAALTVFLIGPTTDPDPMDQGWRIGFHSGKIISGGMMYVGPWLPAGNNENDPCLINPRLSIAASRTRADSMGYWPSYTRILKRPDRNI